MDWDTNPPAKGWLLLFLKFHAIASENHRVLSHPQTMTILIVHSPLEAFCLLLRRRVELFVASLKFTLPSIILTFNATPFTTPIKDEFRVDCSPQLQERHTHSP
jgi:hypothetical protein